MKKKEKKEKGKKKKKRETRGYKNLISLHAYRVQTFQCANVLHILVVQNRGVISNSLFPLQFHFDLQVCLLDLCAQ